MATGPCLCGDPYCPSCGDPSLGVLEDAEQRLYEALNELKVGPNFYDFVTELMPHLAKAFEAAVDREVKERRADDGLYIVHLESKIDQEEEVG